jgi:BirA family biotin operon repressor/biotin-[acetyl-CoA-carboxylase] ligase
VRRLGHPRLHLRAVGSTNERARALAAAGAPHGSLVTADEQTAGRGRQGRTWVTPPGRALAASLVLRSVDALLPLRAGLAVAALAGPAARVKWPNDVLLDGGKVAGILAESRPQAGWAVLGIGVNVAVDAADLPPGAGTLGRAPGEREAALRELLGALEICLAAPPTAVLAELRARDALLGRPVRWASGRGVGAGIDEQGDLRIRTADGETITLAAGEVHLQREAAGG